MFTVGFILNSVFRQEQNSVRLTQPLIFQKNIL